MTRKCYTCKETKPLSAFPKNKREPLGHQYECKLCKQAKDKINRKKPERRDRERNRQLQRLYGISISEYNAMHQAQGGLCAICCKALALGVDHCHSTGRIRGLLCSNCNRAIGLLCDNPLLCHNAAQYLIRYGG